MSREIKFRAWDSYEKEMVDWWHLLRDPDDWFDGLVSGEADPGDALMQYTGLKDKNGVEIYEGDIVRDYDWGQPRQAVGQVHWRMYFWCYGKSPKHKTWWSFSDVVGQEGKMVEVIGNIWEDPELLDAPEA